jgi:hypothetical protein
VWTEFGGDILYQEPAKFLLSKGTDHTSLEESADQSAIDDLTAAITLNEKFDEGILEQRWIENFTRNSSTFGADKKSSNLFHSEQSSTSLCVCRILSDLDEDSRFKFLVPDDLLTTHSKRQCFLALVSSPSAPYFFVDFSDLSEHLDDAKYMNNRGTGRYKFFIRGLHEGEAAVFCKAGDRKSVLTLNDRIHRPIIPVIH